MSLASPVVPLEEKITSSAHDGLDISSLAFCRILSNLILLRVYSWLSSLIIAIAFAWLPKLITFSLGNLASTKTGTKPAINKAQKISPQLGQLATFKTTRFVPSFLILLDRYNAYFLTFSSILEYLYFLMRLLRPVNSA